MNAIVPGVALGVGLLLVALAIIEVRRPLMRRVMPYVEHHGAYLDLSVGERPAHRIIIKMLSPVWSALGSTNQSVQQRLDTAGTSSLERFRVEQVLSGIAGAAAGSFLTTVAAQTRSVTVLHWLIFVALGFVLGIVLRDRILTARAKATVERISIQVANTAQLLALSVSAGEPIPAALERIQRVSGAELSRQIDHALRAIHAGVPVSRALRDTSKTTPSPQLARLLDTLVSAIERGAPLASTLRDQARDLRDESRRILIERGGRKEIAMLFPVVFLILPITIVFALYPGLVALRL